MPARARVEPLLVPATVGGSAVVKGRAVKLTAGVITHAGAGDVVYGIVQGSANPGATTTVMVTGRSKAVGSAAIPIGVHVSSAANGKLREAVAGDDVIGAAASACSGLDAEFTVDVDTAGALAGGGGGGGLPPVTGNDGYAVIEVGSVAAFRPILASYIQAAFDISAFSAAPGTQEVGATVTNPVSFTAAYNRTPDNADVVDDQGNPSLDVTATPTAFTYPHAYTKTGNNESVTFTLSAADGTESDIANTSISWRPRVYHGVGVDGLSTEADIEALASSNLQSSRAVTFTDNPGVGQHIYFAAPTSYGTPTFTVNGFSGGFTLVGTVSVTNIHGVTQNYDLWKSVNPNLGSTTVVVS